MRAYIIRRLLLLIPTLFILTILVFLSVRFIPGDAIDTMVAEMEAWNATGADIDREALERMLGLDVPVYVQYGRWIGVLPTPDWVTGETDFNGLLQGTFGQSLFGGSVEERILGRLPVTIELGVMAIVIGLVIALPVGIYSAIRQDTVADYVGRTAAVIGLATPNFWLGIMVMLYPVIWWGWAPSMELIPFTEDPLGNLGMFIVPSLILGTALSAATMRMTRTMMLEVLKAGLYPHRLGQGAQGERRRGETRRQECLHPGYHPDRPAVATPGRGRRDHGEHLQPAGDRSSLAAGTPGPRLPGGLRSQPVFRRRGDGHQSPHRPDLSLFGPEGAV